jgi:hypothetical protein
MKDNLDRAVASDFLDSMDQEAEKMVRAARTTDQQTQTRIQWALGSLTNKPSCASLFFQKIRHHQAEVQRTQGDDRVSRFINQLLCLPNSVTRL